MQFQTLQLYKKRIVKKIFLIQNQLILYIHFRYFFSHSFITNIDICIIITDNKIRYLYNKIYEGFIVNAKLQHMYNRKSSQVFC